MEPIRLVTVHPLFTHFTLGAMPLLVVAYAAAALLRSERWAFAADVILVVTALLTVVTVAFGLVSNWVLDWPGGIGAWRWVHLGAGAASGAFLLALAAVRVRARRVRPDASGATFAAAATIAVLVGFTSWVGGELLVYRAGMGVRAAADGALAPPLGGAGAAPRDFMDAMGLLRSSWSVVHTEVATMIVDGPSDERFHTVAAAAARMRALATWVGEHAEEHHHPGDHDGGDHPHHTGDDDAGEHHHAEEHATSGTRGGDETADTDARHLATVLGRQVDGLEAAATGQDLSGLLRRVGEIDATCAACHEAHRWNAD